MNQGRLPDNQIIDDTFLIRQAVEGMQDALYISDLRTGELTYFNPAFNTISGLSTEEIHAIRTAGVRARIHPEDRERYLARIDDLAEAARRTGTPQSEDLEYRWLYKDGTYHWISNSRTLLLDEQGQPKLLVGTLRDVTAQKETEQALQKSEGLLREVLSNSRDAVYRHNLRTGTFDYFSPAIQALTGYTAEELIGMTAQGVQELLHPDDRPTYNAHTQALLESANPVPADTVEYRWKTKGGAHRWFSNSRRVVCDESRQPVALVGTLRDVTEQKEAEAEREEALRQLDLQRAQMQTVFEQLPVGLVLAEAPSGKLVFANQQVSRILRQPFGLFSKVEEYDSNLGFHSDGRPYAPEEWPLARSVRHGEEVRNEEIYILRGDGTDGVISISAAPIYNEQGQVVAGAVVLDDITERKEVEAEREQLLAEQDRERSLLETIMENTPAALAYLDRDFRFVQVNSAYTRDARYSREELLGRNHFDLFPNAENQAIFEHVRDTGESVRFEAKPFVDVNQPEKGLTYWDWSLIPVRGPEGRVEGLVFSLLNVTEHERLRAEVERRVAELNATIGAISDGLVIYGPQGEFRHLNQAGEQILGITADEWAAISPDERAKRLGTETPDGRPLSPTDFPSSRALRGETLTNYHMVIHHPDGTCVDLLVSAAPIRDTQGEIIGVVTNFADITPLVTLQEQVQNERARLQAVLEALPVGVFLADPSGRLTLTNQAANELWGRAPLSESWNQYSADYKAWWPETGQRVQSHEWPLTRAVERGETSGAEEMAIETADGQRKTILNYALPVRDASGALIGGVEVDVDITERKQAEEELQRYRLLSENAHDIILFISPDGHIVEANLAAEQAYGYSRDELLTKVVHELRADHTVPLVHEQMAQADAGGITFETFHQRRDGTAFPVEVSSRGATLGGQRILLSIVRDITERKQAEQALRESEARFRTILSNLVEGVVLLDAEGVVQHMNDAARDALGQVFPATDGMDSVREAAQNVLGRSVREITDPTQDPRHRIVRSDGTPFSLEELPGPAALRTGQAVRDVEMGVPQRDGTWIWVAVNAQPIVDDEGRTHGAVVSFFDITERRQAEQALRESEERFATAFRVNPNALVLSRVEDGLILDVNDTFLELFQWSREEVIGKTSRSLNMFAHPEERDQMIGLLRQSRHLRDYEIRIRRKSGEERIAHLSSEVLQVAEGPSLLTILQDVTERKQAEEALRESEERFRQVFKSTHDGIYRLNMRTSTYDYANPALERITGFTSEELAAMGAKGSEARLHPEDRARMEEYLKGVFDQQLDEATIERVNRIEYRWRIKSGEYRWFSERRGLVTNPDGSQAIIGSLIDVTERKQAEEALRELNETLEQRVIERTARLRGLALELTRAEERERRRLAQLLHDHLQQLLAAARISVNMVRNRMEDDHQAETLGQVDALLEESIAESRSLTAELSPPVLYDAGLPPALDWLARWIEEKYKLHVEVQAEELDSEVPEEIRLVLFQGARELLFNVVKHAGVDQARVELRRLPEDQVELVVSDQGVGVDPSQIGHQDRGGFGLFNIRERLESLGGQMQIDSTPGQGTRVTLRVPLHPTEVMEEAVAWAAAVTQEAAAVAKEMVAAREKVEEAVAAGARIVRVLLADDHVIMRQGLARLLEDEPGIELVGQADDGREVVELARVTHPDIVLMDVSMPVMDGIEATRQIKADLPDVRVIGLSMYEGAEVAARMREAGAVDYVPKGGNPAELVEAVRRAAAQ